MAEPITLKAPKPDVQQYLRARLDRAPAEHAEALLAGFEVLQCLYDKGVLDVIRGLLGSGDEVLGIAVQAANTPEAVRAMRSVVILARVLGAIDPVLLEKFARAVPDALEAVASGEQGKAPGLLDIARIFRSPNLRRGLAVVNNMLEAWGRNFSTQ